MPDATGPAPDPDQRYSRHLQPVRAAARRGAYDVCPESWLVREVVEQVLDLWEDACLRQRPIADPPAWSRKVARHRARAALGRRHRSLTGDPPAGACPDALDAGPGAPGAVDVERLLADRAHLLTPKQLEAVQTWLALGTVRAAARHLGRDRSGIRRLLGRALDRLRNRRPGKK